MTILNMATAVNDRVRLDRTTGLSEAGFNAAHNALGEAMERARIETDEDLLAAIALAAREIKGHDSEPDMLLARCQAFLRSRIKRKERLDE